MVSDQRPCEGRWLLRESLAPSKRGRTGGWLPRARNGFDAKENLDRLARIAEEGGRDPSDLSVSVFGAPDDQSLLDGWAEAGITRALLTLPSEPRDDVLRRLDRYSAVIK